MLIGFLGKKEAGKTTSAMFWRDMRTAYIQSFASALKDMLVKADIITEQQARSQTKPPHVRELLQKIGTNIIRSQIDEDFWVKKMADKVSTLDALDGRKDVVIDDVRFINEAKFITDRGGVLILIQRPSLENTDTHRSETELEKIRPHYTIINDGSLDDLKNKVEVIMIKCMNTNFPIIGRG